MKIRLRALLEEKTSLIEEKSRWKKEHLLGNVNDANLNKLRQSGVVKSNEELAKGLNKGTFNMLEKSGNDYSIEKPKFMTGLKLGGNYTQILPGGKKQIIGYSENPNIVTRMTSPVYRTMNFTKKQKDFNNLSNAIALRHEAYEAMNAKKQMDKKGYINFNGKFITPVIGIGGKKVGDTPAGMHLSGDILNRESKDLSDLSYTDAAQHFKKMRNNSGEYEALKDSAGVDLNNGTTSKNLGSNTRKINEHERGSYSYKTKPKDVSKMQLANLAALPAGMAYGLSGEEE